MRFQDNADWFNQRLADHGPVYMETHTGQLIVEPWNALSSLLMLIPALFWLFRIRREQGNNGLLYFVICLIMAGGIGSAIFHGFRASVVFLLMDVLPSAILTLTLSIFFWIKVLKKWWYIFFILIPLFGIRFLFWGNLPEHDSINLSYFITGISVGLPLIILLIQSKFNNWQVLVLAIVSFAFALFFRQIDQFPISYLPMGTHFLWHSFSAVGAYFILDYLYWMTRAKSTSDHYGQTAAGLPGLK
jgi:hemolysin III